MKRQASFVIKQQPTKRKKVTQKRRVSATRQAIVERKYFDNQLVAATITALTASWAGGELDPTSLSLFNPSRGSDINNVDGRKCQVLAIKIRGLITIPAQADATGADDPGVIRLVLVQDKQTNSAQLNAEDVINSGAANVALEMFQNTAFFGRFQVLKDKMFRVDNPAMSWDGTNIEQNGLQIHFKMNHKFTKPVEVHFNATNGGTVADIIDNSFHIIGGCTNTELSYGLNYKSRVTFIDV